MTNDSNRSLRSLGLAKARPLTMFYLFQEKLCTKVAVYLERWFFELFSEPKATTHCHCKMCQKQHGAAFATYSSLPKVDLRYVSGAEHLSSYNSSGNIVRKFCSVCGSSIEWSGSEKLPDWTSIAVATLDTLFCPLSIKQGHQESRACWLEAS